MEQQNVFKTSFYGFDKEAVLKYIDEMSERATKSEDDLQIKVDEITKAREQLEQQIIGFDEKIRNIENELNIEQGKNKKLSEMVENLQFEIERQRRQGEAREREYLSQQEINYSLKVRAETSEVKSKKYDEAAVSIGEAILEAQQTAKRVLNTANEKAVIVAKEADIVITTILGKIDGMNTDFLELRNKMNESINMLNSRFDEIEDEINRSRLIVQQAVNTAEPEKELVKVPVAVGTVSEEEVATQEEEALGKSQVQSSKQDSSGRLNLSEQELQKHRYF